MGEINLGKVITGSAQRDAIHIAVAQVTLERLRQVISFDPETGLFRSTLVRKGVRIGRIGGINSAGYHTITIDGIKYFAHRLAWLYMTGKWLTTEIDHIDGVRSNNVFENLRDVSHRVNMQNTKAPRKHNVLGILGVRRIKDGSFKASITVNKRNLCLGYYKDAETAHGAFLTAKREHHEGCTL